MLLDVCLIELPTAFSQRTVLGHMRYRSFQGGEVAAGYNLPSNIS
jgi:hypothetical protein